MSAEDWNRAADVLAHCGWLRLPDFLSQGLANELANVCTHGWHPLPPEEGVVRQNGFGSYVAYSDADPLVRHVGDALIDSLSPVLAETGFPSLPSFNEASWTRYPRGVGHITAHRDPSAYEGIIAVFTLIGEATFGVWDEPAGSKKEWITQPGEAVVLRGSGWPKQGAICPRHEVDKPPEDERLIMTLRFNTRGAGGGYDV